MFTVLTNTRSSSLYLIGALAATIVIILTLAVVPAISAPERVIVPAGSNASEANSDYFQRHPQSSLPAVTSVETADYFLRHPESRPAGLQTDLSDYFLRH